MRAFQVYMQYLILGCLDSEFVTSDAAQTSSVLPFFLFRVYVMLIVVLHLFCAEYFLSARRSIEGIFYLRSSFVLHFIWCDVVVIWVVRCGHQPQGKSYQQHCVGSSFSGTLSIMFVLGECPDVKCPISTILRPFRSIVRG